MQSATPLEGDAIDLSSLFETLETVLFFVAIAAAMWVAVTEWHLPKEQRQVSEAHDGWWGTFLAVAIIGQIPVLIIVIVAA